MVVFVKYYEMEYDGRRGKRVGIFSRIFGGGSSASSLSQGHSTFSLGPTSPPRERRPLRSVPTVGPHFKVDPEVLAKEYVEKETKYMGTVTDIRHDFDPGNRSMVLSLIDEKRKVGLLPSQLSWRRDVVISFSVFQLKLFWRDGEEVIHRIPTHQIASAGYVQDDNQTILFFKFASEVNPEMANLAFFCCESKLLAQEICYLTQQLFQLAYTNSTMDFFDKSIQDGAVTPKNHSYSTDDSAEKKDTIQMTLPLTQHKTSPNHSLEFRPLVSNGHSSSDVETNVTKASTLPFASSNHRQDSIHHGSNGGVCSPVSWSTPSSPMGSRKTCKSESSSGSMATSNPHQLRLQEYIEVLKERLTAEEISLFAQHLHHFRTGSVPIKVFCEQLMGIYTEQRKSLLLGLRHFLPDAKDLSYFENFLKQHNVENTSNEARWWDRAPHSRAQSEAEDSNVSTAIHINELSSNSDHVSASPTSNEDSGEWKSMIANLDSMKMDDEVSTMKRQHEATDGPSVSAPATPTMETQFTKSASTATLQPSAPSNPFGIVFSTEDGDSPLLRSGQDKHEGKPPIVLHHREEAKEHKRKKSRGKSPSAVELGAPYPSLATGGTDEDIAATRDAKVKRGMKYKKKAKTRYESGDKDSHLKRRVEKNKTSDKDKPTMPSLLSVSTPDLKSKPSTSKSLFKTRSVDAKDGKVTSQDTSSAASTPDFPPPEFPKSNPKFPAKQEYRKKKRKSSDKVASMTSL